MASLKQLSVALAAAILSFPNRTVAGSAETTEFTVRSDSSAIQGGDFATRSVDEEDQRNVAARGFYELDERGIEEELGLSKRGSMKCRICNGAHPSTNCPFKKGRKRNVEDDISIAARDFYELDEREIEEGLGLSKRGSIMCRLCKGAHATSKCPFKNGRKRSLNKRGSMKCRICNGAHATAKCSYKRH